MRYSALLTITQIVTRQAVPYFFLAGGMLAPAAFCFAQAGPSAPSGSAAPAAFSTADLQADTIAGRDTKGPYWLTWHNFRADSETVERGGTMLRRGTDYALDSASGMIAFSTPLRTGETAHITYRTDAPGAAQNTSGSTPAALDFDVWQRGQNRLMLHTFLLSDKNAAAANPSAVSLLQFSSTYRPLRNSDLTSAFYLDLRGGDWLGRSGLRVAEHTKYRIADLGFSYTRAGAQFAANDNAGLKSGQEILEAAGKFALAPRFLLTTGARQATQILDTASAQNANASGSVTRDVNGGLSYALPNNLAKLEAGRAITQSLAPDGSQVTKTLDTVRADAALPMHTQATLSYNTQSAASQSPKDASDGTYAQQTRLEVRSRPIEALEVQGTFQNALGTNGGGDTANLKFQATPFASVRQLRISAAWEDRYRDSGTQRTRESLIELPTLPFARVRISGGFRQTSDTNSERMTGILNAEMMPLSCLEISGGARLRNGTLADSAPDPDYADGYHVKVALAPLRRLRLTGSLSRNPDRDDGTMRRLESQSIGLETEIGSFSLRAQTGVDNEYTTSRLSRTMDFNLILKISRYDLLTTGFQSSLLSAGGLSGTSTYLLSYSRRLGGSFDLNLSGKMIRSEGDTFVGTDRTEYKAEAKIGIHF